MPLPPVGFGPGNEAEKPKESFWSGAPGVSIYRSFIQMPRGFSVEMPSDAKVTSVFADYSASYSFKDGMLISERQMTIKQSKITPEQWASYQTFSQAVRTDQAKMASLSAIGGTQTTASQSDSNPEAEGLLQRAGTALQAHQNSEARDLLKQVERINSKQPALWAMRAYLEMTAGHTEQAIAECRKEIQFHPSEVPAYVQCSAMLVDAGPREEAIQILRSALSMNPEDATLALQTSQQLIATKRYAEVAALLEKPIIANAQRYDLQVERAIGLLRSGNKDEGRAEAQKIAKGTADSDLLNNLAYEMAETGTSVQIGARDGTKGCRPTRTRLRSGHARQSRGQRSQGRQFSGLSLGYPRMDLFQTE
jgi:tetratricopeptide (TPR) repeat protein